MSARDELARHLYDTAGFHAADTWDTDTSIIREHYEAHADAVLAWLAERLGSDVSDTSASIEMAAMDAVNAIEWPSEGDIVESTLAVIREWLGVES